MLRKVRLFFYNNKKVILTSVGVFILIIVIIQVFNYNARRNSEEELSKQNAQANNIGQSNTAYLPSNKNPIMSDSEVSEDTLESDTQIIQNFMDYGNSNNIEGAYNLLSQDCKDEMFSTIDRFYNNYFKDVFSEKKSYDIETWNKDKGNVTYRIKYLNDIMATGSINDEFIEDYFTVITENKEKKLNINQFIRKDEVNKNKSKDGLEISISNLYIYYDYEEYEITFTNNSDKTITIDTKDNTQTVYIKDQNDVEYNWFGNEVPNEYLTLEPGESRTIRIKFSKLYNPDREDTSINFEDIEIEGKDEKDKLEIGV